MVLKVSLAFAKLADGEIDNFAQSIIVSMTGNLTYPGPPVTMASLQAAKDDFITKTAAAQTGGQVATAAKNNSRGTLVGFLRQLAGYVQLHCNNDLAILLSSGFQAQSTNRAQAPLEQPQIQAIKNGGSGQLVASIAPVR